MARSMALALLAQLALAAHLTTVACARRAPPGPDGFGGAVVDTSPTNSGPSPANGHGYQPSAAVVVLPAAGGAPGVSSTIGSRASGDVLMARPCRCDVATRTLQHGGGAGGDGESSAAARRP
uniref:Uncharacterized protein n=1 Tax=Oryza brachyantha TaxID=4533 RepID=J3KZ63_ORYBR